MPFIAKIPVDLVDTVQPAHDQPLQVQLRSDAQIEIDIESIVMRDERPAAAPPYSGCSIGVSTSRKPR